MLRYNIDYLMQLEKNDDPLQFLFFWGHTAKNKQEISKSCLSQWYEIPFTVNNITYPTAEHYMMAQKALLFGDEDIYRKIISSEKPGAAKEFGRHINGFDEVIWDENKTDLVVAGNYYKFSQHPGLRHFLINTGSRILVEASPADFIWGIGLAENNPAAADFRNWPGKNLLGFALIEVRDQLRSSQ